MEYIVDMTRTSNRADPFTAISEPKRRALIETLIGREMTVNQLVESMGRNQPMVSKHLRVLKQAGLVSERKEGRFRFYTVNAVQLKPLQDWVTQFERYWGDSLNQLDDYLKTL